MIEIKTSYWTTDFWWEVVQWCLDTFGPQHWGETWFCQDDYSLYLTEKNLTLFILKYGGLYT